LSNSAHTILPDLSVLVGVAERRVGHGQEEPAEYPAVVVCPPPGLQALDRLRPAPAAVGQAAPPTSSTSAARVNVPAALQL
jgi:hypothetical protein